MPDYRELVEFIVRRLVTDPDSVRVEAETDDRGDANPERDRPGFDD